MSTKNIRFGAVADDPVGAVRTVVVAASPQPAAQPERFITYAHCTGGARFRQSINDPLPAWAYDVRLDEPEQPEPDAFRPVGRCTCAGPDGPCETCESNREAYEEWLAERKVQPEPCVLTDETFRQLAWDHKTWLTSDQCDRVEYGFTHADMLKFARAIERDVLSTRKLSDEQVARIMEAVHRYAYESEEAARAGISSTRKAVEARAEVERLLRGEA